jgi:hypothetical protein
MLTTISDGKMAALCVGGLFAFMGVWAGLLLWVGRDFDSTLKHSGKLTAKERLSRPRKIPSEMAAGYRRCTRNFRSATLGCDLGGKAI